MTILSKPFIELGFDLHRSLTLYESEEDTAHIKGHCIFWNQGGKRDAHALPVALLATLRDTIVYDSDSFRDDEQAANAYGAEYGHCGFDIRIPGVAPEDMKSLKLYARHADGHYSQVNDQITPTEYSALLIDDFPIRYRPCVDKTCRQINPGQYVLQPNMVSACCNCGSGYGEEPILIYNMKFQIFKNFSTESDFNDFLKVLQQRKNIFWNAINKGWVPRCSHCALLIKDDIPVLTKGVMLNVQVNEQCQLKCIYCCQWQEEGRIHLPTYNYDSLLHNLNTILSSESQVTWTGGEPLLLKEFDKLLEMFSGTVLQQLIFSNSICFSETLARLLSPENCVLITSLDSWDAKSYEAMHQRDFFTQVCDNLRRYAAFSLISKEYIFVKYLLSPKNSQKENILAFLSLCKELGIKNVVLSYNRDKLDEFTNETEFLYLYFLARARSFGLVPWFAGLNAELQAKMRRFYTGAWIF